MEGTEAAITAASPINENGRKEILIGCGLAIGGNMLISISLNLQKYTHLKNADALEQVHYLKRPIWWLGLTLMALGEIGNFSAYGFAPASLVAPLGSTTVIANMFIAVIFLKEKLRPEDVFGCTFAILGAFLLVTFSSKSEYMLDAKEIWKLVQETGLLVYIAIELMALVVLLVIRYKFEIINVLVLLLITSLLASFTVIGAKASSSMLQLTIGGSLQIQYPIFWVMLFIMIGTAVLQVKYLNQAMKDFDATVVVPINFVLFTISAILSGVIFYKEFWGLDVLDIFMFLFGCLLCFIGVYFITAGRTQPKSAEPKPDPPPKLIANIFPSWLFSTMNRAEVQPRPHPYVTIPPQSPERISIMRRSSSSESDDYSPNSPNYSATALRSNGTS